MGNLLSFLPGSSVVWPIAFRALLGYGVDRGRRDQS